MPKKQNKNSSKQLKRTYDFSLTSDKSKQDIITYCKKYGWEKTLSKLRISAGEEEIINEDHIVKYTFDCYKGTIILFEDVKQAITLIAILDQRQ